MLKQLPPETGPLRLRALRHSDLEPFLAYRGDLDVARYQAWSPMSPAQAAAFLAFLAFLAGMAGMPGCRDAGKAQVVDLADRAT